MVRGKIIGLGLEEFMSDIIEGINNYTNSRVLSSDLNLWTSVRHLQKHIRANGDAYLKFALDYVDKWVMYNNLFN